MSKLYYYWKEREAKIEELKKEVSALTGKDADTFEVVAFDDDENGFVDIKFYETKYDEEIDNPTFMSVHRKNPDDMTEREKIINLLENRVMNRDHIGKAFEIADRYGIFMVNVLDCDELIGIKVDETIIYF